MLTQHLDAMAMELVQNELKSVVENAALKLADHIRSTASPDELESISEDISDFKLAEKDDPIYRLALESACLAAFKVSVRLHT